MDILVKKVTGSSTPLIYINVLFVLLFCVVSESSAQFSKPIFINKTDTVVEESISEFETRWTVNNKVQIYKFNFRTEIWHPYSNYTVWQLDPHSQIWTIPKAYRLWYSKEGLAVWKYNPELEDWLKEDFAPKTELDDSTTLWRIKDSIAFTERLSKEKIWKVDTSVILWKKEIIGNYDTWRLNDTASFWKVDSLQHVHLYHDSTEVWELDRNPRKLEISQQTSIWTLLPRIEVWKAGNKVNIWSYNKIKGEWLVNDTLQHIKKGNRQDLWVVNKDLKVLVMKNDSVQIWRRNPNIKVWTLSPKLRAWHYKPPPLPKPKTDSVLTIIEPEIVEKINLLQLAKQRKSWFIDDSTQIWQFEKRNELWKRVKSLQKWHVDDSTDVWSIYDRYQITNINKNYRFWEIDSVKKKWNEIQRPRNWQINDTAAVWWIGNDLSVSVFNKKLQVWEVKQNINISEKPPERSWQLNDTSEYWQLNDTSLLWTPTLQENGEIWKREEYTKLPLSDSVFFWRVDDDTRISRLGDSLTLWELKDRWTIVDSVPNIDLNDSTKIWFPTPEHQIWQGPNSTKFWRKNKGSKVYRLRDSIRAWTFYQPPNAIGQKANSKWKLNGHWKINSYQNQLRNWSQGGESSLSFQTEMRLDAKYATTYVQWDSWTELKYGVNIPGEKPMQKSEDKIEIDTRLKRQSKSRWSYTLHNNIKTQFTEGRDYNKDQKLSDFIAPVYFNLGLGMDYQLKSLFNVYLSPLTAKVTHVNDTVTVDQTKFGVASDKKTLNQTGAYINGTFNMNLSKNIRLETRFTLFSNYFENPENIDIDWFSKILLNVNKYISTEISLHLIYDDDIIIPIYQEVNGTKTKVTEGPRLQMQQVFKVGFQWTF